jgi:hypothetical protein
MAPSIFGWYLEESSDLNSMTALKDDGSRARAVDHRFLGVLGFRNLHDLFDL